MHCIRTVGFPAQNKQELGSRRLAEKLDWKGLMFIIIPTYAQTSSVKLVLKLL